MLPRALPSFGRSKISMHFVISGSCSGLYNSESSDLLKDIGMYLETSINPHHHNISSSIKCNELKKDIHGLILDYVPHSDRTRN